MYIDLGLCTRGNGKDIQLEVKETLCESRGELWFDLLRQKIDDSFQCCRIAGIMGFKRDFHAVSVEMGSRLVEQIEAIDPERLLTDCLSCRLQFNRLTPYKVLHPVEMLQEAYCNAANRAEIRKAANLD